MKLIGISLAGALGVALATSPAMAQKPESWLTRCNKGLADDNAQETGHYIYQTRGKVADPAQVVMDYTTAISGGGVVYPGAAKDFLNRYSSPDIHIGYYSAVGAAAPYAVKPTIGEISASFGAKDFKPIPGSEIKLKITVDGVAFGPYPVNPSSMSSGTYRVWLDTEATDGDSKPPLLKPAEFAKLAKAVDAMKTIEIALVQDGADIARAAIPGPKRIEWRDGLAAWAAETKPGVSASPLTSCRGGGNNVN